VVCGEKGFGGLVVGGFELGLGFCGEPRRWIWGDWGSEGGCGLMGVVSWGCSGGEFTCGRVVGVRVLGAFGLIIVVV
jgi:hypothetical protein